MARPRKPQTHGRRPRPRPWRSRWATNETKHDLWSTKLQHVWRTWVYRTTNALCPTSNERRMEQHASNPNDARRLPINATYSLHATTNERYSTTNPSYRTDWWTWKRTTASASKYVERFNQLP